MSGGEEMIAWGEALDAADAAVFVLDVARDRVVLAPSSLLGEDFASPATYAAFLERVHADDRARVDAAIRRILDAPVGAPYEDELRTVAGGWIGAYGRSSEHAGERRIAGVLRKHDERRRVDDLRLRAIQDLSLSSRSADVFVSMIAHELKNPINAVAGTAQSLREDLPPAALRASIARIRTNTERLRRMLEHVRDYARQRPAGLLLERTTVDLAAIVERGVASADAAARCDVEATGSTAGSWDEARLEHAVAIFVDAAVRLAEGDGRVRARVDGGDPLRVTLTIATPGVPSERTLRDAFRPFAGDDAEEGLGLFGARQAVVAHGGDVSITAVDGETRLVVALPRAREEPRGVPVTDWEELAAAAGGLPLATRVTASLYGSAPLYERAPASYWKIFERYAAVFDDALNRRIYRGESRVVTDETRSIAEALGALGAGANEVAELHARALKRRLRDASPGRAAALVAEGRLVAFELMGHLVMWYRRRAIIHVTEEQPLGGDEA